MALGADVWDVVETGYVKPIVLTNKDDKLEFIFNAKAMNVTLSGLAEAEFVKVMHLESAKVMWDKLISNYVINCEARNAERKNRAEIVFQYIENVRRKYNEKS